MFYLLRSSAIVCDPAILRSYGNQSSAICDRNVSHNNFNSDSNDSKLLSNKAWMFVYVRYCSVRNTKFSQQCGKPQFFVSSWIFFELKTDVSFAFEADDAVASGLKEEVNLLAAKFPPRCPLCCLLKRFCREHNARVHWHFCWPKCMAAAGSAIVCDRLRLYGNSSLCDRLRSAICDPRSSAIVCDHMEISLNRAEARECCVCGEKFERSRDIKIAVENAIT